MKLHIRNMVCNRCRMVVKAELEKLGYNPLSVDLGEVELSVDLDPDTRQKINEVLKLHGFSLIDDKKSRMIEQVKKLIVELVHYQNNQIRTNLSAYLSQQVHHDYSYLTNLFSETQGTTIEQYYISQKIERVKELLVYDELSLSEIAFQLNYSSVAHLSNQFKKVTGLTPSHFRNIGAQRRIPLDEV